MTTATDQINQIREEEWDCVEAHILSLPGLTSEHKSYFVFETLKDAIHIKFMSHEGATDDRNALALAKFLKEKGVDITQTRPRSITIPSEDFLKHLYQQNYIRRIETDASNEIWVQFEDTNSITVRKYKDSNTIVFHGNFSFNDKQEIKNYILREHESCKECITRLNEAFNKCNTVGDLLNIIKQQN